MTTLLELPVRDISLSEILAIQAKYPTAMLRVEAENGLHNGKMDDTQFWAILDLLNWKTRNSDTILAPAVKALSLLSLEDIQAFHTFLNEKLYVLDGQRFAEQLGSNRYISEGNKHFSVDGFLYARCCIVANGKKFYEKVLEDPSKMPKEYTFESLLYLPRKAWEAKTGRDDYDFFPETWVETFSNPIGWPGITPFKDRLANLL